jgi:hypothetical protein
MRRIEQLPSHSLEFQTVFTRISDPRIAQAQRHGIIVGLPREDAYHIAMMADLLCGPMEWRDLTFMFPDELAHHDGDTWKVRVDERWWVHFEWIEEFGAVNVRLNE